MFGKVVNVVKNTVYVENLTKSVMSNLKGIHVVFESQNTKIIGQIIEVQKEVMEVLLIGEIIDGAFVSGVFKFPDTNAHPRIVTGSELITFIGSQDVQDKNLLLIGTSTTYNNFVVTADINAFFSNHFAIIGNSGSGKSCGVARLLQNVFYNKKTPPVHAHIVLFDVYGEYHQAFSGLESIPGIHVRNYQNDPQAEVQSITFPAYFLDADDLAILLDVDDSFLIPVLEKTLQYVSIFKSDDPVSLEYKNNIIATALLDVLASGKTASQIRDQVISILNKYNTPQLNVNSEIKEPGYTRTVRQCLNIDAQGKINAITQINDFLSQFQKLNLNDYALVPNLVYSLEDVYDALEFALLSEGVYNSVSMYERAMSLKTHLHQIITGPYAKYFRFNEVISKKEYVEGLFKHVNGENVQIVDISLNHMEDRFAKIMTKLYSKLFFDYATALQPRGSFPINIILEEAHRYVQNDRDLEVLGYNIFDRITKEGRKYGVLMGFITQRPMELSTTALSQCSNFLVFQIFHPADFQIIESITSSVTSDELERLKTLRKGMCLVFGNAFHIPIVAKLDMPNPPPSSSNIQISEKWF